MLTSVVPAAVMAVLGAGVAACLLVASPSTALKRILLGAAGAVAVLVLALAFGLASRVWRRVSRQVEELRSVVSRNESEVRSLAERVLAGERFAPADAGAARPGGGDPFAGLAADLERARLTAGNAVVTVAARGAGSADHRMEVFVNIARRMQSMVHREIGVLDELESQVEDPDLLKGLFRVDHLATRMLREAESLSVLGGALPQRRWSAPVSVYEVVRAAVAETEHYSRVKVIPPVEGTLAGNAVADVIHLLAELVENATKFSPEDVTIRVTRVSAGIAIDVDDRGLGMDSAQSQQMNALLNDPSRVNVGELLRDGRIGLFVVSTLARRQGVNVRLQGNLYGGTQASVVVPDALVDPQDVDEEPAQAAPSLPVPPPRPTPPHGRHAAPSDLPRRRSDTPEPTPADGGWGSPSAPEPEAGAPQGPAASTPESASDGPAGWTGGGTPESGAGGPYGSASDSTYESTTGSTQGYLTDSTQWGTNGSTAESTSDSTHGHANNTTPRSISGSTHWDPSASTPGSASEGTHAGASGNTPGSTSDNTHGHANNTTPRSISGSTYWDASGSTPGSLGDSRHGSASSGTPGTVSGSTPEALSGGTHGTVSGGTQGGGSGGTPGAVGGGTHGGVSGSTPGVVSGGAYGGASGGAPGSLGGSTRRGGSGSTSGSVGDGAYGSGMGSYGQSSVGRGNGPQGVVGVGGQGLDAGPSKADDDRPPLPIRPVQQSLAAPLRDGPPAPSGRPDTYSEHSPNLMAAFQSGFGRSEQDKQQDEPEEQQEERHGGRQDPQHEQQQNRAATDSAD